MDAAYFRAWRAANPAYRRRESERSRQRRLAGARGDRTAEYARRRRVLVQQRAIARGDNGWAITSHPILDAARAVAARHVRPDRRSAVYSPTYEDAVSTAAVALVEHHDPEAAVSAYMRAENAWAYHTAPLFEWAASNERSLT